MSSESLMKIYVGTKEIKARKCTAAEAEKILGREINTSNSDQEGDGYLVEYKDGYLSWSPAGAFEEAYVTGEPDIGSDDILRFFSYKHLPDNLQEISMIFCHAAVSTANKLDPGLERSTALRKLLEAKDAAVRAAL